MKDRFLLGCERHLVRLVPHQASWADLFREEAEQLCAPLGDRIVRIEHAGSVVCVGRVQQPDCVR